MIKAFALVGIGGAIGCMLRYAVTLLMSKVHCQSMWATFTCNALGCLLIGLLLGYFLKSENAELKLLLVTGLCGGFTTFSTFSSEVLTLWQNGQITWAFTYMLGSLVLGVLFVFLGIKICS